MGFLNLDTLYKVGEKYILLSKEGEIGEALEIPLTPALCFYKKKMGFDRGFDILEFFTFLYPTTKIIPSLNELACFFHLEKPVNSYEKTALIYTLAEKMFETLKTFSKNERDEIAFLTSKMREWNWAPLIFEYLKESRDISTLSKFSFLTFLSENDETAPEGKGDFLPLSQKEIKKGLKEALLSLGKTEERKEQERYALEVSSIFNFPSVEKPILAVLAQAGTGIGKTLGYGVPAYLWTKKNKAQLYVSTYTKALQNQIFEELSCLFEENELAIVKGRENYFCLLNYEEELKKSPNFSTVLGFVSRWLLKTKDGDIKGGDFPSWAMDILGRNAFLALAEKRGECLYKACPFFKKCFIEKRSSRAKKARVIISNHSLVMAEMSHIFEEETFHISHFIFDEAHHLFEAADNAFASELSGWEGVMMHRFLFGHSRSVKRLKGLSRRIDEILKEKSFEVQESVISLIESAQFLPKEGFLKRIFNHTPSGVYEEFLEALLAQVLLLNKESEHEYSLECAVYPASDELMRLSKELKKALTLFKDNIKKLREALNKVKEEEETSSEGKGISSIEALQKSIVFRLEEPALTYIDMLNSLGKEPSSIYAEWFSLERVEGQIFDVAFNRHYVDPMNPLYALINREAKGVLLTSATLKENDTIKNAFVKKDNDKKNKDEQGVQGDISLQEENPLLKTSWQVALSETGARYLPSPPKCETFLSPFNYREKAKVFLVTDVDKKSPSAMTNAFLRLFKASNGGALGLFTAISRLKHIYKRIMPELEKEGIETFAQHCSDLSSRSLVELFRADETSCLLGTDTMRDGIDVPGNSLRLVVFERLPWPRPDILHKKRRALYLSGFYDKMKTRAKLTQGFGRLIRSKKDRGIFVILESRIPSEILKAFPPEVEIEKITLDETIERIKNEFES
ncbi:MAG: ATP-dependent DNA helicase [Alphaproteobacteria bacterium]|nr:ATP-dependent DNA helicase [Alphaproteobacteria bacterium]